MFQTGHYYSNKKNNWAMMTVNFIVQISNTCLRTFTQTRLNII